MRNSKPFSQISSLVVYRLFFHPLARIPGPLIQRISGVPRIWQCYIGNRYLREAEAHEKYGRCYLFETCHFELLLNVFRRIGCSYGAKLGRWTTKEDVPDYSEQTS